MEQHLSLKKSSLIHSVRLPKKTSVPSLFAPSLPQQPSTESFSHPPSSPSPARSNSLISLHRSSDGLRETPLKLPLPSLLDDDPFANLASYTIPQLSDFPASFEQPSLSRASPPSTVVVSPQIYVPPPTVTRPRSSGHGQVRPAYTKPAFAPRPSLPSLHTLAQVNTPRPGRKVVLLNVIKRCRG